MRRDARIMPVSAVRVRPGQEGGSMTIGGLITAIDAAADRALTPAALRLFGPDRKPPASQDEIEAFEAEIGVSLPDDYRRFLLGSAGGSLDGEYIFEIEDVPVFIKGVGGLNEA